MPGDGTLPLLLAVFWALTGDTLAALLLLIDDMTRALALVGADPGLPVGRACRAPRSGYGLCLVLSGDAPSVPVPCRAG